MLFNKGQLLEFGSLAPEVEICFDICLETFMGILSFDAFLTDLISSKSLVLMDRDATAKDIPNFAHIVSAPMPFSNL